MKTIQTPSVKLSYFDGSAKEMPAGRFKDFQKYLFEDWGVGTTLTDLDMRLSNIFQFLNTDAKDKAIQEIYNLRMTANYILNKLSIKSYAFAILISEINGEKLYDYSESALSRLIERFEKEISQQDMETILVGVKKNLKLI